MSLVFDVLDRLAGPMPKRFDPTTVRATLPDASKEKTLSGHVRECTARYVEVRTLLSDLEVGNAKTQRLIWALIALGVAGNTDLLAKIASFVAN